jgi:hypothetical protein
MSGVGFRVFFERYGEVFEYRTAHEFRQRYLIKALSGLRPAM